MVPESLKDQSGVSLIELLVVIVLLGTGFFSLLQVLTFSSDTRAEAEIRSVQATLARDLMNEIRSKRFDEYLTELWSSVLGPEEAGYAEFDDVDDFHGWTESAVPEFSPYSRSVEVVYVDTAGGLKSPVGAPTDYKLVTVTVGHRSLSPVIDSLVVTPGIPSPGISSPFCMAGGLVLENLTTGTTHTFYGPFPKRQMTFTVDGGAGIFVVDCSTCLAVGDVSGQLRVAGFDDPSGQIVTACGGP
ncbi:MAG: prepilin-type N-terminal cleavage/methylation domain-containing protein [Candidatus Neomarinimicrobiota bacterium]